MIEGFEEFTPNVKDSEIETIRMLARCLKRRVGKDNAILNKDIREAFESKGYKKFNESKLRRYIQYIRANGYVKMLCASKKGYYIAENEEDWIRYKEAYRTRVRSMQFTMACMDMN